MEQYKLLFLGPVASGKTEAVRSLCGDNMIETETKPTDEVLKIKEQTTVALDYGSLPFGKNEKLHVYGAPGQGRFKFMIDILSKGCLGVILLINSSHINQLDELENILNDYEEYLDELPYVVGLTHTDKVDANALEAFKGRLSQMVTDENVMIVDPRERSDVARLVETVIRKVVQ